MKRIYEYEDEQGDRIIIDLSGSDLLVLIESGDEGINVLLPLYETQALSARLVRIVESLL